MNSQEIKDYICRICLDESVVLDWDSPLYGYCDITYKDCFYKYTQLKYLASDPFSPMLCQICLNGLYNIHTFILKALDSQKYFTETRSTNLDLDDSIKLKDVKYTPPKFETVLVEKVEIEHIIPDHFLYEPSEEITKEDNESKAEKMSKQCPAEATVSGKRKKTKSNIKTKLNKGSIGAGSSIQQTRPTKSSKNSRRKTKSLDKHEGVKGKIIFDSGNDEEKNEYVETLQRDEPANVFEDSVEQLEAEVKKKYKELKKPRMCSICSKILHNKYAVQMHEKTHMENRERKETCKVCGLKFYDKRNLYSHKRIHKANREKIHKCEFCNKAFYDKGGLNIHRRMHLGQMIPCSLCPKQYFRQIDLDRHMSSHSATAINSNMKKRSRYFVRCKHCDKSILSTSFKSHTAVHLNEPLMKCSICSKEFFRRGSCVLHVKKIHQKTNEEYNDFIILYKKNRISHLFLEQKADIQFSEE